MHPKKYRYVPFLRWKMGEHGALANLLPATKQGMAPLIRIGSDNFKGKKQTAKKPAVPAPAFFATEVQQYWGNAPIYVDASSVAAPISGPHSIENMAAAVAANGGHLIPVTKRQYDPSYTTSVLNIARGPGRGIGLIVKLGEATSVSQWIGALPVSPSEIDLFIDFADDVETAIAFKGQLVAALTSMWSVAQFRSVTFSGTSIPDAFTGYQPGAYQIDRREWTLWQFLSSSALPFRPDYGDYATVSVAGPPANAVNAPINAKYTLPSSFLVCKGVRPSGQGAIKQGVQLAAHAQTISAALGAFQLPSCWGDDRISAIARGIENPSSPVKWVGFSVNRHIELVRHQLP